ncbi:MAG: hypothetical protein ACI8VW_000870 [bacterium]|jgi:hypothetical protein
MTDSEQESRLSKSSEAESSKPLVSESNERSGTGFWNVVQSVAAAMIGVQSSKNKERDFNHGKPIHFIVGGVVGTLLLLLVIWLIVQFLIVTS